MKRLILFLLCIPASTYVMSSDEKLPDGIHPYEPKHEQKVKAIAIQNIDYLVSYIGGDDTDGTNEEKFNEHVAPTLTSNTKRTSVLIKNGEPVGFITYKIAQPWYRIIARHEIGPNAEINHLAVDSSCRKCGYGKELVTHALDDCQKQSVNRVSLWVTAKGTFDNNLAKFYRDRGFNDGRRTKLHETQYALRLKPHPAMRVFSTLFTFLKRI